MPKGEKPRISKTKAIEIILKEIEERGITYNDCFDVIRSKSELAQSTFSEYWKEANLEYSTRQEKIKEAALEDSKVQAIESRLESLFTKEEYAIGLKKMWDADEPDLSGKYPAFKDRLQAGKQVAELFGWNAPAKQETIIRSKNGKWIFDVDFSSSV